MSFLHTLNEFKIFKEFKFHPINLSRISLDAVSHGQLRCGQSATSYVNLILIPKKE